MRIPYDSDEHRNMCISGEIMMTTPLKRDYLKEQRASKRGVGKNLGGKSVREKGKTLERTLGETQRN